MIYLNTDSASYKDIANIELNDNLSFSEVYFYYEKIFWITYNKTYLISGFSENKLNYRNDDDINNYKLRKNTESPFEFLDDITIKSIKFIRNTKYVYYNIIKNSNNKNYIGVIDIQYNIIKYNTENILKKLNLIQIKVYY